MSNKTRRITGQKLKRRGGKKQPRLSRESVLKMGSPGGLADRNREERPCEKTVPIGWRRISHFVRRFAGRIRRVASAPRIQFSKTASLACRTPATVLASKTR